MEKGNCLTNIKNYILKLNIPSFFNFQKYSEVNTLIDKKQSLLTNILLDIDYTMEQISDILEGNYNSDIEHDLYMYMYDYIKNNNIDFKII